VRKQLNIRETPSELLELWEGHVCACEGGYQWDYSEYLNELRVRDVLEAIMRAPELAKFPEHAEFEGRVNEIDRRFRSVLMENARATTDGPWWRMGVLRKAGSPYVEYCAKALGINVESVDP